MAKKSVLITGASGYIGGSILTKFLTSTVPAIKDLNISVMVRNNDQAVHFTSQGVKPIQFKDLDDSEALTAAAREHDVVIHNANGFHAGSAKALILGLSERKKAAGTDVYYIHTSGTSNLADAPFSKGYVDQHVYSDEEDIFSVLKAKEAEQAYAQRTTDITVVETGQSENVQTYILMSPTIYGKGTGPFHTSSIQLPALTNAMIKAKRAEVIGNGEGIWNYVHISDLTTLYELFVSKLLSGADIPSGPRAIFFTGNGEFSWKSLADGLARAGHKLGLLDSPESHSVGLEEAAKNWLGGNVEIAEAGFASNARTTSKYATEKLGWVPEKGQKDWEGNFEEEFRVLGQQ